MFAGGNPVSRIEWDGHDPCGKYKCENGVVVDKEGRTVGGPAHTEALESGDPSSAVTPVGGGDSGGSGSAVVITASGSNDYSDGRAVAVITPKQAAKVEVAYQSAVTETCLSDQGPIGTVDVCSPEQKTHIWDHLVGDLARSADIEATIGEITDTGLVSARKAQLAELYTEPGWVATFDKVSYAFGVLGITRGAVRQAFGGVIKAGVGKQLPARATGTPRAASRGLPSNVVVRGPDGKVILRTDSSGKVASVPHQEVDAVLGDLAEARLKDLQFLDRLQGIQGSSATRGARSATDLLADVLKRIDDF